MTTTVEAPTTGQCGAEAMVERDRGTAAVAVACDLERNHRGWHEGALKDEQGKVDEMVTWR